VSQLKARRGTEAAIVGTRATCQPIEVFSIEAPAPSIPRASITTASRVDPSGIRSIRLMRQITMASGPTDARTRRTTSTGRRIRFSSLPPRRSSHRLV
jgi:hypothetical protein